MRTADQRRYPRFPFHSRGTLKIGTYTHPGTLVDISIKGGLFTIDGTCTPAQKTPCHLDIFYGGHSPFLQIEGAVVYCTGHLIGIEFDSVNEEISRGLHKLIEMNLATPALLQRDIHCCPSLRI